MMASSRIELGPTGERVRKRVAALRERRGLSRVELSKRLTALGHPLGLTALGRIEAGERRVDVDDLFALAVALNVSPLGLLLPQEPAGRVRLTESVSRGVTKIWEWAVGVKPLNVDFDFGTHSTTVHPADKEPDYFAASSPPVRLVSGDAAAAMTKVYDALHAAVKGPDSDRHTAALAASFGELIRAVHDDPGEAPDDGDVV